MAEAKRPSSTTRKARGASIAKVSEASSRAPEAPPAIAVPFEMFATRAAEVAA